MLGRTLWQRINSERFLAWGLVLVVVLTVWVLVQRRAALVCSMGLTTCVFTQSGMIPSKTVVEMLDDCDDFTRRDIGYTALRLSVSEILQKNEEHSKTTGQSISPLFEAHYAWGRLYESRLSFDREQKDPAVQYAEIRKSCTDLRRDFYDKTKWVQ